mmetsp:Transcript_20524/g.48286  ORF Transcript_20524/g.48286 Transcript_20524/m.48286 type:complete len:108 (-) Transcript_20524:434-757(-)
MGEHRVGGIARRSDDKGGLRNSERQPRRCGREERGRLGFSGIGSFHRGRWGWCGPPVSDPAKIVRCYDRNVRLGGLQMRTAEGTYLWTLEVKSLPQPIVSRLSVNAW